MELELSRAQIACFETAAHITLCQEETQEAIVPDACPDVLRLVQVCARANLGGKQARDGAAAVHGTVEATILYQPEGGAGVCRMEMRLPFECQADAPGLTGHGTVFACPRVRRAEARLLNPRKVLLRVDLAVEIRACQPRQMTVCRGITTEGEGIQQRLEQRETYPMVAVQEKPFTFGETLRLPFQGEGGEVYFARALPVCTESKLIGSKLIFKGETEVQLLLRDEGGALEPFRQSLPFSQIMEVPGVGEGSDCEVTVEVVQLDLLPSPEGGKQIEVQMELLAQAAVRSRQTVELLQDAYSTQWELETERQDHVLPRLEDASYRSQSIRELVETAAPVRKIVDCWAQPGEVRQSREGNQMSLHSEVCFTVLYLDEEGQLQSVQRPVTATVRVDCPQSGTCQCRCTCPGEIFATPTAGGLEIRGAVEFQYMVLCQQKLCAIAAARLTEPRKRGEGACPSMVLRLALPGERLWDIAKSYATTTQQILQANELEEEELPSDRMLLIPRARS